MPSDVAWADPGAQPGDALDPPDFYLGVIVQVLCSVSWRQAMNKAQASGTLHTSQRPTENELFVPTSLLNSKVPNWGLNFKGRFQG